MKLASKIMLLSGASVFAGALYWFWPSDVAPVERAPIKESAVAEDTAQSRLVVESSEEGTPQQELDATGQSAPAEASAVGEFVPPAPAATPLTFTPHEQLLSPAWVHSFTHESCEILVQCRGGLSLAMRIAEDALPANGEMWSWQTEERINAFLRGKEQAERIAAYKVQCTNEGCLMFVGGDPETLFGGPRSSFGMNRFRKEVGKEQWTKDMQWLEPRSGMRAEPGYWMESFDFAHDYGLLVVFRRKESSAGK